MDYHEYHALPMYPFSRAMARVGSESMPASRPSTCAPGFPQVQGVAYIGVLKDSPNYGAKPLAAGVVTLRGQSSLTWDELKKTASLVGKDYFFKTAVHCNESMSMVLFCCKFKTGAPLALPLMLSLWRCRRVVWTALYHLRLGRLRRLRFWSNLW